MCIDCRSTENLQLDHVDPKTKVRKFDHAIWSRSWASIAVETAKCVVRCYDCHLVKSKTEKVQGTACGSAKLTEQDVLDIRILFRDGRSKRGLARQFGVDEKAIRCLLAGTTWGHVGKLAESGLRHSS